MFPKYPTDQINSVGRAVLNAFMATQRLTDVAWVMVNGDPCVKVLNWFIEGTVRVLYYDWSYFSSIHWDVRVNFSVGQKGIPITVVFIDKISSFCVTKDNCLDVIFSILKIILCNDALLKGMGYPYNGDLEREFRGIFNLITLDLQRELKSGKLRIVDYYFSTEPCF